MFVNKLFTYLSAHISKSKRCFNVKSSNYFHRRRYWQIFKSTLVYLLSYLNSGLNLAVKRPRRRLESEEKKKKRQAFPGAL